MVEFQPFILKGFFYFDPSGNEFHLSGLYAILHLTFFPIWQVFKYVIEMTAAGTGEDDTVRHRDIAIGGVPENVPFQFPFQSIVIWNVGPLEIDVDDDVIEPP